jgi:hypothetical protein
VRTGPPTEGEIPNHLLVVEGPDDAHALHHLMLQHGISDLCLVEAGGGLERILDSRETRILTANEERLGIIIDVDPGDHPDAIEQRWTRIRDVLVASGYQAVPGSPSPSGTVVERGRRPLFGAWPMTDNQTPGTLEDFCHLLIPSDEQLWTRALQAVRSIPQEERRFPERHTNKADLHTWLAWQEEPGKPIGQAISKGYLDANAPPAQGLISWLRTLFSSGAS